MGKNETRRSARERAFQVLYGLHYAPVKSESGLRQAFSSSPDPLNDPSKWSEKKEEPVVQEPVGFAWELTLGAWSHSAELDKVVMRFSQNWRIERIARTELTILRLALYEMLHRPDIPVKVAINEAVELAKRFGDENSRSFINGILDAAAKAIENGEIGLH